MGKRDGRQKGAQTHAEGEHGSKAHSRLIESLQEGAAPRVPATSAASLEGAHRLHEDREQHEDAEKHSEKNRVNRDSKRGRLDERSPQVAEALKGSPPAPR
jgi:hypothetical protein